MKIVKLTASNFKKLVAVEITPEGNVVRVTGKNGAGKSSVLDAIIAGLCGKAALPQKPIRDGAKTAEIVLDVGELVVTRKFTGMGSYLEIRNKAGFEAPSPQTLLDQIVGKIAFDPLAFCRLGAKEQRQALLDLVGLDVTKYDREIERLRQERAALLAQKKRASDDAARLPTWDGVPDEPVSVTDLAGKLMQSQAENETIRQKALSLLGMERDIRDLAARVDRLSEELDDARARLVTATAEKQRIERENKGLVPHDLAAMKAALASAEAVNAKIAQNKRSEEAQASIDGLAEQASIAYEAAKTVEEQKSKALAAARMPLAGLGVSEGTVTFEGIPLAQVNHAKQVEVSLAIAMAMNPDLRVMLINGNGLDTETMAAIDKLVTDHDYQLWIERATDGEPVGIVIEDGQVKATKGAGG